MRAPVSRSRPRSRERSRPVSRTVFVGVSSACRAASCDGGVLAGGWLLSANGCRGIPAGRPRGRDTACVRRGHRRLRWAGCAGVPHRRVGLAAALGRRRPAVIGRRAPATARVSRRDRATCRCPGDRRGALRDLGVAASLAVARGVLGTAGLAAGLSCYLVIGALVVAKDPFPAKVCLTDGEQVSGVLIGETDSRTYLGDPQGARPRRVISIPQSHIERLVVGGSPAQLDAVRCDAPPEVGPAPRSARCASRAAERFAATASSRPAPTV